jgi:hypothetical protein
LRAKSGPIADTKAEADLRARKIFANLHGASRRYHPALLYLIYAPTLRLENSTLIATVINQRREIVGIDRSLLDPVCNAKANIGASASLAISQSWRRGVVSGIAERHRGEFSVAASPRHPQ